MSRVLYMHTIEGRPAYFSQRDGQIVFADRRDYVWHSGPKPLTLCKSLRAIRAQQKLTLVNRLAWGMADPPGRYGYARVVVP